jgi:hypothetical protein
LFIDCDGLQAFDYSCIFSGNMLQQSIMSWPYTGRPRVVLPPLSQRQRKHDDVEAVLPRKMFFGHEWPSAHEAFAVSSAQQASHVQASVKSLMTMVADAIVSGEVQSQRSCKGGTLTCVVPYRSWRVTVKIPGLLQCSMTSSVIMGRLVDMYRRLGFCVVVSSHDHGASFVLSLPALPRLTPLHDSTVHFPPV